MSENSAKYPRATIYFCAALQHWFKDSGKKQVEAAAVFGMTQGTFNNLINGKKGASVAQMEEIADKLGKDLADMLAEGRSLLAGETPPQRPPVARRRGDRPQPPPTIDPERELELLRRIEAITIKWENLSDELLVKDGRIKAKDKLISQLSEANGKLIDILKEAGEDDRIPPDLILAAVMTQAETERTDR